METIPAVFTHITDVKPFTKTIHHIQASTYVLDLGIGMYEYQMFMLPLLSLKYHAEQYYRNNHQTFPKIILLPECSKISSRHDHMGFSQTYKLNSELYTAVFLGFWYKISVFLSLSSCFRGSELSSVYQRDFSQVLTWFNFSNCSNGPVTQNPLLTF